jgi:hypothetical protein
MASKDKTWVQPVPISGHLMATDKMPLASPEFFLLQIICISHASPTRYWFLQNGLFSR